MTATHAEPFLELIPTKGDPRRVLRWEPNPNGLWSVGTLTIDSAHGTQQYAVDECAADVGREFVLRKPGGGFACVSVRGWGADTCSCDGFRFSGGRPCKHLEAVRSLLKHEQL